MARKIFVIVFCAIMAFGCSADKKPASCYSPSDVCWSKSVAEHMRYNCQKSKQPQKDCPWLFLQGKQEQ